MIIGNGIGEKACEPWVIWDGITNIAEIVQARVLKVEIQDNVDESNTNESNTTSEVNDAQDASNILWSALGPVFHYMLIICNMLRSVVIMLVGTSSLPSRLPLASMVSGSVTVGQDLASPTYSLDTAGTKSSQSESPPFTRPILSMSIWKCASDLLDLDARMPWLSATFSMIQWWARHGPGHVGETDGVIDRYVISLFFTSICRRRWQSLCQAACIFSHLTLFPSTQSPDGWDLTTVYYKHMHRYRRACHSCKFPAGKHAYGTTCTMREFAFVMS